MDIKFDCRFFTGDKPCQFRKACSDCSNYKPMGKKILIIKLAALGDVLRTTSILPGLERKYPGSHITWLVNEESYPLLENNPLIHSIMPYNLDSVLRLLVERFDLALSLDKAWQGVSLAMLVKSKDKKGFGLNEKGRLFPLNKESEYAFLLGIDDNLKFKENKKTYQEIIYDMCVLDCKNDEYILNIPNAGKFEKEFLRKNRIKNGSLVIGLNTGSGEVFAAKKWTIDGFIELARLLNNKLKAKVILLGGPNEEERNREIKSRLKKIIVDTGCHNSLKDFIKIVNCCSLLVSGDTLAMQIAIALKKKVVALFGPTCHQEVSLYGRGEKIVSGISCAPCYRQACDDLECMSSISPKRVFHAVQRLVNTKKR